MHFRPGFEAEARVVARLLELSEASVDPSPPEFTAGMSDANIIVVLGQDFVDHVFGPRSSAGPTTTAPDTPADRLQSSAIRPDGFGPMFVGMPLENALRLYGESRSIGDPPPCRYLAYADGGAPCF